MDAVISTFVAGVEAVKQGIGEGIGSLTQLGTIPLGKHTEARTSRIKDFVPLAPLQGLSFGAWTSMKTTPSKRRKREVLDGPLVQRLKDPLSRIKVMKIIGNRDGSIGRPCSFKTKQETKVSVLEHILQPDLGPELYKNFYHAVPAAPLIPDLVLLLDLGQSAGMKLNNTLRWIQGEDSLQTWPSNTMIETRLRLSRPT